MQKGHGVSLGLIDDVREVGREFFNLPREEKLQVSMNNESGYRSAVKLYCFYLRILILNCTQ